MENDIVMKLLKVIFAILTGVLFIALMSCKKEYSCTCTFTKTVNGYDTYYTETKHVKGKREFTIECVQSRSNCKY